MPTGPAARVTDNVVHPLPPVLGPGPGSLNVLIGSLPAWRGVGGAVSRRIAGGQTDFRHRHQGGRGGYSGGGRHAGRSGRKGGGGIGEGGLGGVDGQHDHELGRRRRHPFLRHAFAHPAARSGRGDRRFANGADQQPPGLPHGRHRPGGGRPAQQDRQRRNDGHHRRLTAEIR